jgi:two-component system, OmpR family, response regulator
MADGIKAFVVEDSPTIRENLIETLQELVCVDTVGTAQTEHDGTRWLLNPRNDWDMAIVDIFLREGNGLNIVAACQHRCPRQKVVVLSNHVTADMRTRCARLGADAFFDKSTEIEDLLTFCQQHWHGRDAALDLYGSAAPDSAQMS